MHLVSNNNHNMKNESVKNTCQSFEFLHVITSAKNKVFEEVLFSLPSVCPSVRLSVCPSVCLSVCHQDSEKSFARILTKFGQNVYLPLRRKPINFEISMFHRTVEKNKNAPFSSYKRSFFS